MKKCFLFILLVVGLMLSASSYAHKEKTALTKIKQEVEILRKDVIKQHTAQQMFSRCITPLSMTIILLEKAEKDLQAAIDGKGLEDLTEMRRVSYDLSESIHQLMMAKLTRNCANADEIKQANQDIFDIFVELSTWLKSNGVKS
mgnify:CR=1 FL=1